MITGYISLKDWYDYLYVFVKFGIDANYYELIAPFERSILSDIIYEDVERTTKAMDELTKNRN